ncbi:MAG: hypothetical protein DHS20C05_13840 [Hyphococcus sp.]|nr:MAG: hypothetical protein DHS20C05_13840 [Marinicaulis sp.]
MLLDASLLLGFADQKTRHDRGREENFAITVHNMNMSSCSYYSFGDALPDGSEITVTELMARPTMKPTAKPI